mmetsp:Transcript_26223/g.74578  ORF Transcript_26223/g.74578 Transcript_26223/m.74578 type:complete len:329 (-) Transcript_26223:81-1067(-)
MLGLLVFFAFPPLFLLLLVARTSRAFGGCACRRTTAFASALALHTTLAALRCLGGGILLVATLEALANGARARMGRPRTPLLVHLASGTSTRCKESLWAWHDEALAGDEAAAFPHHRLPADEALARHERRAFAARPWAHDTALAAAWAIWRAWAAGPAWAASAARAAATPARTATCAAAAARTATTAAWTAATAISSAGRGHCGGSGGRSSLDKGRRPSDRLQAPRLGLAIWCTEQLEVHAGAGKIRGPELRCDALACEPDVLRNVRMDDEAEALDRAVALDGAGQPRPPGRAGTAASPLRRAGRPAAPTAAVATAPTLVLRPSNVPR